jgi:hypothetical protein
VAGEEEVEEGEDEGEGVGGDEGGDERVVMRVMTAARMRPRRRRQQRGRGGRLIGPCVAKGREAAQVHEAVDSQPARRRKNCR